MSTILIRSGVDKWMAEDMPRLRGAIRSRDHAKALDPFINNRTFEEVPEVVSAIIRASTHLAPATVNARLHILRRVCNLAYKRWDWIEKPIAQKVAMLPVSNERHYYLTRAQVEALVQASGNVNAGKLIVFAAFTGLRLSEMFRFNKHPTLWQGSIRLPARTKNGRPRSIPLHPKAMNIAKQMPLLLGPNRLKIHWKRAREICHLEHIHWHDLRHTFASWILQAGGSLAELKELMGHTTIQQTMRYAHLEVRHLRRAVNRL